MSNHIRSSVLRTLMVVVALNIPVRAEAGPPLLCHEVKVADSNSLPWGKSGAFEKDPSISAAAAVDKTLSLLDAEIPILARMETLRRATLYLQGNPIEAERLMGRLLTRTLDAEVVMDEKALALRYFDAGYLAATLQQAGIAIRFGPASGGGKLHSGAPGYAWLVRAFKLNGGDDGDMATAIALVTVDTRMTEHTMFLELAVKATPPDDAARNDLLKWIAEIRGTTLEAVRAKIAAAPHAAAPGSGAEADARSGR